MLCAQKLRKASELEVRGVSESRGTGGTENRVVEVFKMSS